jgi:hypothetical protein
MGGIIKSEFIPRMLVRNHDEVGAQSNQIDPAILAQTDLHFCWLKIT